MSERRAFFGTIALSSVSALRLGLQFAVLPVLARILGPDAFGLIGLAMPFVLLASMSSDAGMGNALVRTSNPSWQLESTVFWLSVGISAAMAGLVCALSPVISLFFHQPALTSVLIALSLILVLSGSLSVANSRITRRRDFAVFAIGDFISAIISAAAGIISALHGFGIWSLVLQQLVLWIAKAAWIFPIARFRPRFFCSIALVRPYLHFGINSAAANISDFVGKNLPFLVVGQVLGVTSLGHYSMSYQLTRVAELVVSGPVAISTFAAVARAKDRAAMREFVLRSLRMILILFAPLFCGLYLTADLVVALLLGPKWAAASPTLAALAPAGFFLCVFAFIGSVLLGAGNSARQFRLTLMVGAAMLIGAGLGTFFGTPGVGAGVSLGAAILAPFYFLSLTSELQARPLILSSTLIVPLASSAAMACAVLGVRSQVAHLNPAIQLAASVIVGGVTFAAALVMIGGRQLGEDVRRFRPGRAKIAELGAPLVVDHGAPAVESGAPLAG